MVKIMFSNERRFQGRERERTMSVQVGARESEIKRRWTCITKRKTVTTTTRTD